MEQVENIVATDSTYRLASPLKVRLLRQTLWCRVVRGGSLLAWLIGVTLLAGCGGGGPAEYTVQGTVTYADKAVPTGWVIFLSSDQKRSTAEIGSDGKYQTELPAGQYLVGVSAPRVSDKSGMEAFDQPPMPPHVPHRYAMPKSSGLSATVEANDENNIDLTLKEQKRRRRR